MYQVERFTRGKGNEAMCLLRVGGWGFLGGVESPQNLALPLLLNLFRFTIPC